MSEFTKNCRKKMWLYRIIDWMLLIIPIFAYICIGLSLATIAVWAKATMIGCCVVAIIIIILNTILKKRLRCPMWICLTGLIVALHEILLPLFIVLAIVTVLDDLILTPLIESYRAKYEASKTMDEREEEEGE